MLTAKIIKYSDMKGVSVDGDFLEITNKEGRKWSIHWQGQDWEEDYIQIYSLNGECLKIIPRAGNVIRII